MPESEAQEKESSVKWAREAFEFLKFFRREQKYISGLLLLEIGWALLLALVAKLSPPDAPPILGVPSPWDHWHAHPFPLTTVFLVGGVFLAVFWFFSSGLFVCLRLFVWRLLWYPVVLLSYVVMIAMAIVTLPVLLIGLPIEHYCIRKWESKQTKYDPKKLADLKKNNRQAFFEMARKESKFTAGWLGNWLADIQVKLMVRLSSNSSQGIAALYSYSYDEDEKAAKAPMQMLATAMGRLQTKLRSVSSVHYIHFQILPPIVTVTNSQKARFVRKMLGLDAVLWGSYLSTDPPRIWLNIDLPATDEEQKGNDRLVRSSEVDPFQAYPEIDPTIEINQNELWDVYVAFLVTLLQVLQVRQARKFTIYPKSMDRLYYSISDREAILTYLVRDALFSMPATATPAGEYPTAKEVLVSVAGSWIAKQLGGYLGDDYSGDYELLRSVAAKCVELRPEDPGGYYRLAALQCLLDDASGAKSTIATGIGKDKNLRWIGWAKLSGWAGLAISELDWPTGKERVKVAKAVVYAARAVAADDYARKGLWEDLKKTSFHLLRMDRKEMAEANQAVKEPQDAGVQLLYELLSESQLHAAAAGNSGSMNGTPPKPTATGD